MNMFEICYVHAYIVITSRQYLVSRVTLRCNDGLPREAVVECIVTDADILCVIELLTCCCLGL